MRRLLHYILYMAVIAMVGCKPSPIGETEGSVRHYDVDYNFVLVADSLVLQEERPMHLLIVPETADSFVVYKDDPLVVAQFEIIPEDSIDSVWVKVARDQLTQGWVHESALLEAVVPDDPISQGIHLFSDSHVIGAIVLFVLVIFAWVAPLPAPPKRGRAADALNGISQEEEKHSSLRGERGERPHLTHIHDIASPYPMLLCLVFAAATVLYTTIQIFVPGLWADFYFHPTLNPFGQPTMLAIFLALAWLIVVLLLASMDDIRRCLPAGEAILYALSLLAILAGLYLFFSIATQYYLGYFLWMLYAILAFWQYLRHHRPRYRCGQCGAPLHDQNACTKCGASHEHN